MNEFPKDTFNDAEEIPASMRRKRRKPTKVVAHRISLSWWEELTALAREHDLDISTFLRQATEDWLNKARKVHQLEGATRRD